LKKKEIYLIKRKSLAKLTSRIL